MSDFLKQTQIYDYTSTQFLILDGELFVSDFISRPPFWYLTAYIWVVATTYMLTFHPFGDQDIQSQPEVKTCSSTFLCIILLSFFWVNKHWDNILLCADILQHWLSALTTIQIFVPTSVFNTTVVFNHKDSTSQPGNPMTNSTKDFTVNKTMNETSFWHTEQLSAVFCRLCIFFPQVEKQLQKQGAVILAKEN